MRPLLLGAGVCLLLATCTHTPPNTTSTAPKAQASLKFEPTCRKRGPQPLQDTAALDAMLRADTAYRHLSLRCVRLTPDQWSALADSPALSALEHLELSVHALSAPGTLRLLSSPKLTRLQKLHIADARHLTQEHWDAIGANPGLRRSLRHLSIHAWEDTFLPTLALGTLAQLELERLELRNIQVRGPWWETTSPIARTLAHLTLKQANLGDTHLQNLTSVPLPKLERLDISANAWTSRGWSALGRWLEPLPVQHLDVSENLLSPEALTALLPQNTWARLKTLGLEGTGLTSTDVQSLAKRPWPRDLRVDLRSNPVDAASVAKLKALAGSAGGEVEVEQELRALGPNIRALLASPRLQTITELEIDVLDNPTARPLLWAWGEKGNIQDLTISAEDRHALPTLILGNPMWRNLTSLQLVSGNMGDVAITHANAALTRIARALPTSKIHTLVLAGWDGPHALSALASRPETSGLKRLELGAVNDRDIDTLNKGPGLGNVTSLMLTPTLSAQSMCTLLKRPLTTLRLSRSIHSMLKGDAVEHMLGCWDRSPPTTLQNLHVLHISGDAEAWSQRLLRAPVPKNIYVQLDDDEAQAALERSLQALGTPDAERMRARLQDPSTPKAQEVLRLEQLLEKRDVLKQYSKERKPLPEVLEGTLEELEELDAGVLKELLEGPALTKVRRVQLRL